MAVHILAADAKNCKFEVISSSDNSLYDEIAGVRISDSSSRTLI